MKKTVQLPLVKLPEAVDTTLFLIREELKIRKVFKTFNKIGLGDSCFEPHLDKLILRSLNLDDGKDETFLGYTQILEKRSRKITSDFESIMQQTMKAYRDLQTFKEQMNTGNPSDIL